MKPEVGHMKVYALGRDNSETYLGRVNVRRTLGGLEANVTSFAGKTATGILVLRGSRLFELLHAGDLLDVVCDRDKCSTRISFPIKVEVNQ